jgi:soluble lytic murein transglycosylase
VASAAELVLARAAARLSRPDEAIAWYRRVAAAKPRVPGLGPQQLRDLPEEAAYLAAWLHYDAGRYARAAELLGRYARAHPQSKRALDARWFRAWSFYRAGRSGEARRALASLSQGPLGPQALYWQARLARDPRRQAELYRATAGAPEGDWYSLLAAARLQALGEDPPPFPAPVPPRPLPEGPADARAGASLALAEALLGAGLREEALAEVRALSQGPLARARAAVLAQLATFAGDPEIPFRMARDHLLPTARALRWGHPQAYPEALRRAAAGFGVDPWLLLAAMRRESGFRVDARSGAAAEGLLQLIPPTAERLATLLGVPQGLSRRLREPEVSISFGAHYLGLLAARFGDGPLLLAAYNAGPAAAASWARARAGLPLDEWVEDIPYRETRQYVRLVMADRALYRRLHGEGPAPLDPGQKVQAPPPGVGF